MRHNANSSRRSITSGSGRRGSSGSSSSSMAGGARGAGRTRAGRMCAAAAGRATRGAPGRRRGHPPAAATAAAARPSRQTLAFGWGGSTCMSKLPSWPRRSPGVHRHAPPRHGPAMPLAWLPCLLPAGLACRPCLLAGWPVACLTSPPAAPPALAGSIGRPPDHPFPLACLPRLPAQVWPGAHRAPAARKRTRLRWQALQGAPALPSPAQPYIGGACPTCAPVRSLALASCRSCPALQVRHHPLPARASRCLDARPSADSRAAPLCLPCLLCLLCLLLQWGIARFKRLEDAVGAMAALKKRVLPGISSIPMKVKAGQQPGQPGRQAAQAGRQPRQAGSPGRQPGRQPRQTGTHDLRPPTRPPPTPSDASAGHLLPARVPELCRKVVGSSSSEQEDPWRVPQAGPCSPPTVPPAAGAAAAAAGGGSHLTWIGACTQKAACFPGPCCVATSMPLSRYIHETSYSSRVGRGWRRRRRRRQVSGGGRAGGRLATPAVLMAEEHAFQAAAGGPLSVLFSHAPPSYPRLVRA